MHTFFQFIFRYYNYDVANRECNHFDEYYPLSNGATQNCNMQNGMLSIEHIRVLSELFNKKIRNTLKYILRSFVKQDNCFHFKCLHTGNNNIFDWYDTCVVGKIEDFGLNGNWTNATSTCRNRNASLPKILSDEMEFMAKYM